MAIRRKYIATLVERLLKDANIVEAPVEVQQIAEKHGIKVYPSPGPEDLCGFLYRDHEANSTIIGVNANHPINRRRFTVAHELGHYLLHTTEPIHVDRSGFGISIKRRDDESSKGTSPDEIEANTFAAELLMPSAFLKRDIAQADISGIMDEHILRDMAKRYKVSVLALTFRLTNLGFIQL